MFNPAIINANIAPVAKPVNAMARVAGVGD